MTETQEITKTKGEVKEEVETLEIEERQTIVHCNCNCSGDGTDAYRIWPNTYLVEHGSDRRAKLITTFNISFAPQWTINIGRNFTLIFEGLSKDCKSFDLIEVAPQLGGFKVFNIPRNNMDVYQMKF